MEGIFWYHNNNTVATEETFLLLRIFLTFKTILSLIRRWPTKLQTILSLIRRWPTKLQTILTFVRRWTIFVSSLS